MNYLNNKEKIFLNQIGEIYYNKGMVKVLLKGRRTDFILKPCYKDFMKLKFAVGHLDKKRFYPKRLEIADKMVYWYYIITL